MRSPDAALTRAPRGRHLALPLGASIGGVVLAATLPILFLHVDYQPAVSLPLGATFKLSDAMVLLTALAAAAAAMRGGLARLRPGLPVWITGALLLAWIAAATVYPLASARAYAWRTHAVTAGEFAEYALLAPAVPLLLRRRADAVLAAAAVVCWNVVATAVGLAQWAGWSGLGGWGRGLRQPSFLGTHDFAALAGLTLGIGLVALLWDVRQRTLRRGAWLAVVTGAVGFVLGGATAGVVGLVPAALLAAAIALRRRLPAARRAVAAALAATALASIGVVALRTGDFDQFFRFVGAKRAQTSTSKNIQTYSQRTLLGYIGLRIWLHHPVLGVGWQGSSEPSAFVRELPPAHRRFPRVASIAFPSAKNRYGVQVLYVQVLADLGVIGGLLLLGLAGAGLVTGARGALHAESLPAAAATLGVFGLVLALGLWTAQGLVAGLPLDALTWLGFGLVAVRRVEPT